MITNWNSDSEEQIPSIAMARAAGFWVDQLSGGKLQESDEILLIYWREIGGRRAIGCNTKKHILLLHPRNMHYKGGCWNEPEIIKDYEQKQIEYLRRLPGLSQISNPL
jgi:hypothetical protein